MIHFALHVIFKGLVLVDEEGFTSVCIKGKLALHLVVTSELITAVSYEDCFLLGYEATYSFTNKQLPAQ